MTLVDHDRVAAALMEARDQLARSERARASLLDVLAESQKAREQWHTLERQHLRALHTQHTVLQHLLLRTGELALALRDSIHN